MAEAKQDTRILLLNTMRDHEDKIRDVIDRIDTIADALYTLGMQKPAMSITRASYDLAGSVSKLKAAYNKDLFAIFDDDQAQFTQTIKTAFGD